MQHTCTHQSGKMASLHKRTCPLHTQPGITRLNDHHKISTCSAFCCLVAWPASLTAAVTEHKQTTGGPDEIVRAHATTDNYSKTRRLSDWQPQLCQLQTKPLTATVCSALHNTHMQQQPPSELLHNSAPHSHPEPYDTWPTADIGVRSTQGLKACQAPSQHPTLHNSTVNAGTSRALPSPACLLGAVLLCCLLRWQHCAPHHVIPQCTHPTHMQWQEQGHDSRHSQHSLHCTASPAFNHCPVPHSSSVGRGHKTGSSPTKPADMYQPPSAAQTTRLAPLAR
jgi:hypothetical protein